MPFKCHLAIKLEVMLSFVVQSQEKTDVVLVIKNNFETILFLRFILFF